ncbi:hypothetical protein FZC79_18385 [Rossellomorea vietnamensis]|uniref:Uncharacterized protein n=1 Tax=Rossellomorea vietnamensis TaxID=218284 RepID=A0A5D4K843_9BACI|nr:hypothetical protein [Rossellomorea vietnamensis]TYR73412.1 hypothetical protein FZC79_18385 [Rossellomorea vietnamensis]
MNSQLLIISVIFLNTCIVLGGFKAAGKQNRARSAHLLWILWMALFLPVIGSLFGAVVWYLSGRIDRLRDGVPAGYMEMTGRRQNKLEETVQKDREAVPTASVFRHGDSRVQKEFLLNLHSMGITRLKKSLDLALSNDDSETVHYAATTSNLLQEKFRKDIEGFKQRLVPKHAEGYRVLADHYISYLKSGMASSKWQEMTGEECIHFLKEASTEFPEHPDFLQKQAYVLEMLGRKESAREISISMLKKFPEHYGGYEGMVRYCYEEGKWEELKSTISAMKRSVQRDSIPNSFKMTLGVLEGTGEWTNSS